MTSIKHILACNHTHIHHIISYDILIESKSIKHTSIKYSNSTSIYRLEIGSKE